MLKISKNIYKLTVIAPSFRENNHLADPHSHLISKENIGYSRSVSGAD